MARISASYQDILNFKQGDLNFFKCFTEMCVMCEELDHFRHMLNVHVLMHVYVMLYAIQECSRMKIKSFYSL